MRMTRDVDVVVVVKNDADTSRVLIVVIVVFDVVVVVKNNADTSRFLIVVIVVVGVVVVLLLL